MVVVLIRLAVLGLVLGRLALTGRGDPAWATGVIPALLAAIGAASAIMSEPRAWLRRAMMGLVVLAYAVWMLRDDDWRTDWFFVQFALLTLGEATLVALFVETRLWRWSLVPGLLLASWLAYHVFPVYANDVLSRRASWLTLALLLLAVNGGRRAMREEDDAYKRAAVARA